MYVARVTGTRTDLVETLMARFPHIPREAVLKEDLLRTGMAFDDSALSNNLEGEVKPKSYFIFSFDQKPLAELGEAAKRRPPEELALTGGPYELRRTIVSVRVNPTSPYRVSSSTRRTAPRARRPRDRGRDAAADARVLPPRAGERQDGDGDRADDPVGLPRLPHRAPAVPVLRREGGMPVLRHQSQLAPAQERGTALHGREAGRRRDRGARADRSLRRQQGVEGVHAHRRFGDEHRRRAGRSGLLRPLCTGDRGALPRALDRQGRRTGAAARRRPAIQGLRHHDLPPELRGLGQAPLLAHLARQGTLRRPRGVAPPHLRRRRGVRRTIRDPEFRRRRRDGGAVSGSRRSTRRSRRRPRASTTS